MDRDDGWGNAHLLIVEARDPTPHLLERLLGDQGGGAIAAINHDMEVIRPHVGKNCASDAAGSPE